MTFTNWRTSSYSLANGNCCKVAAQDGTVGIRDSKNKGGPVLVFSDTAWGRFLRRLRDDTADVTAE